MTTTLYPGIPFSPQATITNNIGAADSIIEVSDVSAFPPAPNLATIGTDEEGETILYTAKTETALSGCQRGVEGTARAWTAGELIGRNFTARDHADLIAAATEAYGAAEAAQEAAGNAMGAAQAAQEAAATAGAVAAAKQPKLTGAPGQSVGFGADGAAVAVPGWSNPNLLLNWDFRNPVNQNGRTEYTSAGYAIDRWKLSNGKLTLSTTGAIELLVNTDSSYNRNAFVQLLDNPTNFVGKTLTFSILANDINGTVTATAYENGAGSSYDGNRISSYGLSTVTFTIPATAAPTEFRVHVLLSPGGACRPIAAKLELGTQQTLARQNEDGEWEIIDPPDYDLQYALCSLYSPSTGEWVGYQHSNPNLLDNWYFVDPVNQRGKTEYTATGYTIDRFKIGYSAGSTFTCGVEDNGVSLTAIPKEGETSQFNFYQIIPANLLNQGTYTLSFLYSSDCAVRPFAYSKKIGSVIPGYKDFPASNDPAIAVIPIKITSEMQGGDVIAYVQINTFVEAHVKLYAAKLELGPVQTLAHQDADGNWVLNDPPPNKALELAKCQRYAKIFRQHEVFTVLRVNPNYIDFLVPVGIKMRSTPTIIGTGWGEYLTNGFTLTVAVNGASQIMLRATKTNHGLSNPSPMTMRDSVSGFSSDL